MYRITVKMISFKQSDGKSPEVAGDSKARMSFYTDKPLLKAIELIQTGEFDKKTFLPHKITYRKCEEILSIEKIGGVIL